MTTGGGSVTGATVVSDAARCRDRRQRQRRDERYGDVRLTHGGGSVGSTSVLSDANGLASTSWTLGTGGALNTLRASLSGGAAVDFLANAIPPVTSGYDIALHWNQIPNATNLEAFEAAVARWQGVITGDLSDIAANHPANECGMAMPAFQEPSMSHWS